MKIKQQWAEIAEYSSLVGLVVVLMYRQIAVIPILSVFMWLNFRNRQYSQRATYEATQAISQPISIQLNHVSSTLQSVSQTQTQALDFKESVTDELTRIKAAQHNTFEALSNRERTIQTEIDQLSGRFNSLRLQLEQEFEGMKRQINALDGHCAVLADRTSQLDQLDSQVQRISGFVQVFSPLRDQVTELVAKSQRIDEIEALLTGLSDQFKGEIDQSIGQLVTEINQQFQYLRPDVEYKLVFDRAESRQRLLQAINESTERLILVCPWLTRYALNGEVIRGLKQLLKENRRVDIGWGSLKDLRQAGGDQANLKKGYWYDAIADLERLGSEGAPLQLKFLGTHEKYLVCDRNFAMLGSHNFLTSGDWDKEREVGIYTNDPSVVCALIERFEQAENLGKPRNIQFSARTH